MPTPIPSLLRAALLILLLALTLGGCVHADPFLTHQAPDGTPWDAHVDRPDEADLAACLDVLEAQRQAWNAGDLPAFVDGYLDSEALVFSSGDDIRLGRADLLARYRERYPDRAAMGRLTFGDLVLVPLGRGQVLGRGTWLLARADDRPWGRFALVLVRTDAGWRVRLDHTTLEGDAGPG